MKEKNITLNILLSFLASSQNPFSLNVLKKTLSITRDDLHELIALCNETESHPFIIQILPDDTYSLKAKKEYEEYLFENNIKQTNESLSKAAEEVLALLLYKGKTSKQDLDWLRGVNSTVSLRNLMEKGLVMEEINNENSLYFVTEEIFDSLGLSKKEDLHNFESITNSIINVIALKQ